MLQMDIVDAYMKDLGYKELHRGTKFVREAVRLYSPEGKITELYGRVGREYGRTPSQVERCMRTANDYMFFNADMDDLRTVFGGSIDRQSGKLTNGEVVAQLWHLGGGDDTP